MDNIINISEKNVSEFLYDNFKIVYEDSILYAESLDPEIDDIILIEDNDFKMEKDLELFNGYVLTKEELNRIKEKLQ